SWGMRVRICPREIKGEKDTCRGGLGNRWSNGADKTRRRASVRSSFSQLGQYLSPRFDPIGIGVARNCEALPLFGNEIGPNANRFVANPRVFFFCRRGLARRRFLPW